MKTKPGFNLREICGQNIILAEGEQNIDFSSIISMNESAAFLWKKVQEMPSFTIATLIELLQKEYDVDTETAYADCNQLAATWAKAQIIEGEDIPEIDPEEPEQPATPAVNDNNPVAVVEPKTKKKGLFARLFGK